MEPRRSRDSTEAVVTHAGVAIGRPSFLVAGAHCPDRATLTSRPEGVFGDECGRYPAGSGMRSPHGSRHAPSSPEGALIRVKVGPLPMAAES